MLTETKMDSLDATEGGNDIVDIIFDVEAVVVPDNYPFELWDELVRCLPWLTEESMIGVHPLRGSVSEDKLLLSKRTKLSLRLPVARAAEAAALSGNQLRVSGNYLKVGKSRIKPLQMATTLHAHIVESNLNEVEFIAEMKRQLELMNVSCNLICDKYRKINFENKVIQGFGLVLHDLKLPVSLTMQSLGLGGSRHLGCGIFVPFKAITGLD